jgi:hypothetical protein
MSKENRVKKITIDEETNRSSYSYLKSEITACLLVDE